MANTIADVFIFMFVPLGDWMAYSPAQPVLSWF